MPPIISSPNGDAATIGINGFGRIGRAVLRAALTNPLVRVAAINDPYISAEYAAYLIASDAPDLVVEAKEGAIIVNGNFIEVSMRSDPASIPWKVTYVVDCSGVFTTSERAGQHLASGAGRVVVANVGADMPTFVVGVNEDRFAPTMQVVSAGSPTGVVLAAALRCLSDAAPIEFASFTAVHAATGQQRVVNGVNVKEWAAARAASNTIPFATGAQRTLLKVMPSVASAVVGNSYRVPTAKGCVLDLTVKTSASLTKEAVEACLLAPSSPSSSSSSAAALFVPAERAIVSGDAERRIARVPTAVAAYDPSATQALGDRVVKLGLWYDNEASYARAVLALVVSTNRTW